MVDCNQALCEMFGASREQLVGRPLSSTRARPNTNASASAWCRSSMRRGHYADDRLMKRLDGRFKTSCSGAM